MNILASLLLIGISFVAGRIYEYRLNLKVCESYIEGKNELYKLENGYTIHPKELKMVKNKDYSVEVTHIPTGIIVKCHSTNSILKNKNKCLEVLEEELIKINAHLELKDLC